ncbi:hypothetical protein QIS74_12012 [Colletotrichum tabaci]|uniref:Protein kinase domain-containing protein n=1 Tax=Colletotrichum tabaci TaxID=1209068 RepID=A0AAV9SW25_9PEZI
MSEINDVNPDREFARYDPGQKLTLYPYKPVEPYGLEQYDQPKSFHYEVKHSGWVRNFDPTKAHKTPPKQQARIEVVKLLSGGIGTGPQVLLCKVTKAPDESKYLHAPFPGNPRKRHSVQAPSLLVAKVFDSMFFPGRTDFLSAIYGDDVYAEQLLSREAGALAYLYERGLPVGPAAKGKKSQENNNSVTGHPHLVPQYYGSWTVGFNMGENDKGVTKYRCAGLLLMEYIEGRIMEQVCVRDSKTKFLRPNPNPLVFHEYMDVLGHSQKRTLTLTEDVRLKIFRDVAHEVVSHMHIGIEHSDFLPENLMITLRDHGSRDGVIELDEPRVVLLDYTLTEVWRKTRDGKQEGQSQHCLEMLPLPPHPLERFSPQGMPHFIGWFNAEWTEEQFDNWARKEFGELEEGSEKGSKGKYSTFKTLDKIEENILQVESAKEKKMTDEQEEIFGTAAAMFQDAEKQKERTDLERTREEKPFPLELEETGRPHKYMKPDTAFLPGASRYGIQEQRVGSGRAERARKREQTRMLLTTNGEGSSRVAGGGGGDDDVDAADSHDKEKVLGEGEAGKAPEDSSA